VSSIPHSTRRNGSGWTGAPTSAAIVRVGGHEAAGVGRHAWEIGACERRQGDHAINVDARARVGKHVAVPDTAAMAAN
jgi:hypothetical protein